jgi:hypothetical protein
MISLDDFAFYLEQSVPSCFKLNKQEQKLPDIPYLICKKVAAFDSERNLFSNSMIDKNNI